MQENQENLFSFTTGESLLIDSINTNYNLNVSRSRIC